MEEKITILQWQARCRVTLSSAKLLFDSGDWCGCANRTYYAAYQGVTSVLLHRSSEFPSTWGNPSHEQLPEMVRNAGQFSLSERRIISSSLLLLRRLREDADYRPGRTVDRGEALNVFNEYPRLWKFYR